MRRRVLAVVVLLLLGIAIGPPAATRFFGWGADPRVRPQPGRAVSIAGGQTLNVVETGSGPPVVLVHGLPSCASDWATLPEKLAARGYRVIAYDRVGYGYSSRSSDAPDRYTLEANAKDLAALLDALAIPRAALVGWSYGGGVIQTLAQQSPQRASHLVLVASVGPAQPSDGADPLSLVLASPVGGAILRWVGSVPPLSRRMTHDSLVQAFAREEDIPPRWTEYTRAMLALPGTLDAFVLEAQRGHYDRLQPQLMQVPALVVQGSDDYLVPPAVAEDLHAKLPNSELVMIAHGSHMLPVTHADVLAERIDTFLQHRAGGT